MVTETNFLFGLLLFIAAASGYWLARTQQRSSAKAPRQKSENGFPSELNYLVEDQPDKAIEALTNLDSVNSETLETHFVLASLFRRRGETDRAIRIHQSIIARPEIAREERERALFALAEDYLRAGLLDRAEKLFQETSSARHLCKASLANLIGIYERQKDWQQAIECSDKLARETGQARNPITAHYYCELASESLAQNAEGTARKYLRHAKAANPQGVRAAFLRAELAEGMGEFALARKLLSEVASKHLQFARLAVSLLAASCRQANMSDELPGLLERLLARSEDLALPIAHAVILDRHMDDEVSLRCFESYVRNDRVLGGILGVLEADDREEIGVAGAATMHRIRLVLRRLALDGPRYGCVECGFAGRTMAWRCSGCLSWDSTFPTANLKFDSHLGSMGYIQ